MSQIEIQIASDATEIPHVNQLELWCNAALAREQADAALALRIVDIDEMQALNHNYRGKNQATNVLAFPCDLPADLGLNQLGDVVICAKIVTDEAKAQQKTRDAHWAHIVVHGTLHLLGYDHIEEDDANEMEALETRIVTDLGFPPPYDEQQYLRNSK